MCQPHVLIARASRAYRFCPACLSLVAIELIARGPSAYRSSGVIDNCTCKITIIAKGLVRLCPTVVIFFAADDSGLAQTYFLSAIFCAIQSFSPECAATLCTFKEVLAKKNIRPCRSAVVRCYKITSSKKMMRKL